MFKKTAAVLVFSSLVIGSVNAAETCSELNIRLKFNANGTITDTKTGLTWRQCNVGQEWKGGECTGNSAKYAYSEIEDLIKASGLKDQGYRLPTLTELMDISAFDCGEPAVHSKWSSVSSGFYWTSTGAFGDFQNTVLMTTGEEYPMSPSIGAWAIVVK